MPKPLQLDWINKGLISILSFTTVFVGVYISILYFNTDLSNDSKVAQAALACPNGGADNGSGACVAANKTPAYYACPGGYFLVDGTNCVAGSKAANILHVSQCASGNSIVSRITIDNNPNQYSTCDGARTEVESVTLDILNNRYLTYEFCESFDPVNVVTRFRVGNADPGNPCDGDANRQPIPDSGEGYHLTDLYLNRYSHMSLCQSVAVSTNIITRFAPDNDPTNRNVCAGDPSRFEIEGPTTYETGRANQGATYVAAVCPSGWADAGGSNCYYAANGALTSADILGLTVVCNQAISNSVTSCTFDNLSKTLPSDFKLSIGNGGINAGGTTPAQSCSESSNVVTCQNVPTGNSVGYIPIYGNLGSGNTATKTDTAETVMITGDNFAKADWIFNPDQGGTSPLFRSADNTSITIKNVRTVFDSAPSSNTRYFCDLQYRSLSDRLSTTGSWTTLSSISTPIPYNTTSGCTFNFTKSQRANSLNYGLRLSIIDVVNTTPSTNNPNTFYLYNEYIYRFQGAGTASGG